MLTKSLYTGKGRMSSRLRGANAVIWGDCKRLIASRERCGLRWSPARKFGGAWRIFRQPADSDHLRVLDRRVEVRELDGFSPRFARLLFAIQRSRDIDLRTAIAVSPSSFPISQEVYPFIRKERICSCWDEMGSPITSRNRYFFSAVHSVTKGFTGTVWAR